MSILEGIKKNIKERYADYKKGLKKGESSGFSFAAGVKNIANDNSVSAFGRNFARKKATKNPFDI